jgi:undecaprenyl-diphosphatase
MVGGLLAGLTHKDAARFSFLLATPVIAGAGALEVPKLWWMRECVDQHSCRENDCTILCQHAGSSDLMAMVLAGIVAGITAYASIALLMHYFKKHEFEALNPFAYYCWAAGFISFFLV